MAAGGRIVLHLLEHMVSRSLRACEAVVKHTASSLAADARCRGIVNMYGVFQTYYSETLKGTNSSAISWIGSIQVFLLCLIGTLVGPIYDGGRVRLLLVTGTVSSVLGVFMTSLCTQYWQLLLAQGLLTGFGFGCLFLPGVAIVSQYFTTKKAFATGIASLGSSIGTYWKPATSSRRSSGTDDCRRRDLPHSVDPAPTQDWVWLGHSSDWFHHAGNPPATAFRVAPASVPQKPQVSL